MRGAMKQWSVRRKKIS
ncbi:hypothetical protein GBAR_LOCUS16901 [Geodia barretti]|uniref:Uncharacterized protein n=1 Tax=Geodia barretti TaxID=519541 RepID=A0AA35SHM3_GEOBA|nr:hypothetical protein GBAR_LOCUS16901 [Geodia barretti]